MLSEGHAARVVWRMKIACFDCFSGISGDMCLGALVDAGMPLGELEKALRKIPIGTYRLKKRKVRRAGLSATKVDVVLPGASRRSPARNWTAIKKIIASAKLPDEIKQKGETVFRLLFQAEGKVHGTAPARTHLHELGATDCMVDIFGTLVGLSYHKVQKVFSSPVNLGSGTTETSHGLLPVPSPAATELLRGVPVYASDVSLELTTPTGAAILKGLCSGFGNMPLFVHERVGVGAGGWDFPDRPNILRLFIGETVETAASDDTVTVIETNIDDMNPQIYGYLIDLLFAAGALDAFLTPIIMKKTRPAVKVTVLCSIEKRNDLIALLFRETTTLGVRFWETGRFMMGRSMKTLSLRGKRVRIKRAGLGRIVKSAPEYDDCRRIAEETGMPLFQVIEEAKKLTKKT